MPQTGGGYVVDQPRGDPDDPMRSPTADRIAKAWGSSGGVLPTRLIVDLAQGSFSDTQLDKAATILSRRFALNPSWLLQPYGSGLARGSARSYVDPVSGGQMSLASARRFVAPYESRIIRQMLGEAIQPVVPTGGKEMIAHAVPGANPKRIADVIRSMAPIEGHNVAFMPMFAAAIDVAGDKDLDLALFERNIRTVAMATGLTPLMQVGAAHKAAQNGRALRHVADVADILLPGFAPLRKRTERELEAQDVALRQQNMIRRDALAEGDPITDGPTAEDFERFNRERLPELGFAQDVQAGIVGEPGDWLKVLQDAQDDYIKAAAELENRVTIPFSDTVVGRFIGAGLEYINRPLDAIGRLAVDPEWLFQPVSTQGPNTSGGIEGGTRTAIEDAAVDVWDILNGRTTAAEEAAKFGVDPWFVATAELALSFWVDPVVMGMQRWSRFKADHMLTDLYANGRSAEAMAKVEGFVDTPLRRVGDLKNSTVVDYLYREATRVKNAERYFGRATDTFRTWFRADGLNPLVAERVFRLAKYGKRIGVAEADIKKGIRGVLLAGFGFRGEDLGDLVAEINLIGRARAAERTQQISARSAAEATGPSQLDLFNQGKLPPAVLDRDAEQALSAVSDDAMSLLMGPQGRMLEVPHLVSRGRSGYYTIRDQIMDSHLGQVVRSVAQTSPMRYGARMVIPIENPGLASRDFRRALLRSQEMSAEEIAKGELAFRKAIALDNPNREQAFRQIVGTYNRLIIERINRRYGMDPALQEVVMRDLRKRLGGLDPRDDVFGAMLADPVQQSTVLQAQRRLGEVEAQLEAMVLPRGTAGQVETAEMATLQAERSALVRRIDDIAKTSDVLPHKTPLLPSQLLNEGQFIDPVLYREGIARAMGTLKKAERSFRGHFTELGAAREVTIPMRKFLDGVMEGIVQDLFMSVWKPLAVIRPAYVLRVPGIEEQARFLATVGMTNRLLAGSKTGPLVERLGLAKTRTISTGVKLPEGVGARGQTIEDAVLFMSDRHVHGIIDDIGWSRSEETAGEALAAVLRNGDSLTPEQTAAAMRLLEKYNRQLATIGINAAALKPSRNAVRAAERAREAQAKIDTGEITFGVPGLTVANEPMVNNSTNRLITASEEANKAAIRNLMPSKFGPIGRDEDHFMDFYYNTLAHQYGQDPIGQMHLLDVANQVDEEDSVRRIMRFLTEDDDGKRFARRLMGGKWDGSVEALEAQVRYGARYVRHLTEIRPDVAASAAEGTLTMQALATIPPSQRPLYVHGPQAAELTTTRQSWITKGRDTMGRWVLQEPTNRLSRQPFFKHWYDRTYEGLVAQAKDLDIDLTPELLAGYRQTARQFAIDQVDRIMFDFSRTGRLEEMTRFMTVFLQPFLEFPLVWGRIIRQNPTVALHATRIGRWGLDSGFIKPDPETGELTIPMSWWAGAAPLLAAVTGGRLGEGAGGGWSLSAPLTAFNLFANATLAIPTGDIAGDVPIPLPSLAPPFQWAMQQFVDRSELPASIKTRLASWLFAYGELGPESAIGLMPSYLRHLVTARFPDQFSKIVDFHATHFLQLQEAMGLEPDAGKAREQAVGFSYLRAFFGAIFPAAPRIEFPTQNLEDELRDLQDVMGYQEGKDEFLKLHPNLKLLTIARTMWDPENPDNPTPVSIPSTQAAQQLLETKGAKEFAEKYPAWAWAIIPEELANGEFDIGTFFSQIATGQRKVLSPSEFLDAADVQTGWDAFFTEDEAWTAWQEANPTLGEGDPPYEEAKNDHDAVIDNIIDLHPKWGEVYNTGSRENVNRRVMATARELARDPMFSKTQVGQALNAWLPLFDDTKHALAEANLTSLESTVAVQMGIPQRYQSGVDAIIEKYPQFETAYRVFSFDQALRQGVPTKGDKLIDALPEGFYDDEVTPWWTKFEARKAAPNMAGSLDERNAAYGALRKFVNASYKKFGDGPQNPMRLWWEAKRGTYDASSYLVSLFSRGYLFYNRFEKQEILGTPSNPKTERLWTQYNDARTAIAAREAADPYEFESGAAYDRLNRWALAMAADNPTFGRQLAESNTWGYAFEKVRGEIFPAKAAQGKPYWQGFLDSLRQIQTVADQFELHGVEDPDLKNRAAWLTLRTALDKLVTQYKAESPAFEAQWDYLEEANGPDPLMDSFMPTIYYPVGVGFNTASYEAAS